MRIKEYIEKHFKKIIELCPYCGEERRISINGGNCKHCKKFILPCSNCDMDKVNCTQCKFENK